MGYQCQMDLYAMTSITSAPNVEGNTVEEISFVTLYEDILLLKWKKYIPTEGRNGTNNNLQVIGRT